MCPPKDINLKSGRLHDITSGLFLLSALLFFICSLLYAIDKIYIGIFDKSFVW